jgi:hypothetical protein
MTCDEILNSLRQTHTHLAAALAGIPDEVLATQPVIDWWTLKDVMGHIAMWERVAIQFVEDYRRDGMPVSLGLNDDAAVDAYNKRGAALRRDYPLARVRAELDAALRDLAAAVESLSDAQLNTPLSAPWGDGVTLERLVAWNSYEHTPEHIEQIARWRKTAKPSVP